jgi:hypothetical protein
MPPRRTGPVHWLPPRGGATPDFARHLNQPLRVSTERTVRLATPTIGSHGVPIGEVEMPESSTELCLETVVVTPDKMVDVPVVLRENAPRDPDEVSGTLLDKLAALATLPLRAREWQLLVVLLTACEPVSARRLARLLRRTPYGTRCTTRRLRAWRILRLERDGLVVTDPRHWRR